MKKILILFVMAFAINTIAQDPVLFRLNYEEGAIYYTSIKVYQDMEITKSIGMSIDMEINVFNVKDDTYESEMKFTKITVDLFQDGSLMIFDSTQNDNWLNEAGKKMEIHLKPMLETTVSIQGNSSGKILETNVAPRVPGMESLAKQPGKVAYIKETIKVDSTLAMSKSKEALNKDFVYKVKFITKDIIEIELSGMFLEWIQARFMERWMLIKR